MSALPPASIYARKELPPIPKVSGEHNRRRPLSDQSAQVLNPKEKNIIRSRHNSRIDGISRPPTGSKSHSLPESVSRLTHSPRRQLFTDPFKRISPPLPMTKSAQKILQFTGVDPSFEEESMSHYSSSPESLESSGSHYSQHESENQNYRAGPSSHQETTAMPLTRGGPSAAYLQPAFYSVSERSASISELSVAAVAAASAPATSLRIRDPPAKHNLRRIDLDVENSAADLTNEEFMAAEMAGYERQKRPRFDDGFKGDIGSRYGHELTDADGVLIPRPLAIRSKPRVSAKNSRFERHYMNPTSPTGLSYDGIPPSPMPGPATKRNFGSGEHPLKNPFPLGSDQNRSEVGKPQWKFKKLSGVMKQLWRMKKSPAKQTVISNTERAPGEPDTPMPSNFGLKSLFSSTGMLQKGNEQLQDAINKARKGLKIKTADEKKRENLKKQIVVVGVTDQSPGISPSLADGNSRKLTSSDGRVSEWL